VKRRGRGSHGVKKNGDYFREDSTYEKESAGSRSTPKLKGKIVRGE